jgi:DNA replication ATP-dependent helicase Dna2
LPVSIGPITLAKTFVLVGDHFQLPPLVKSPVAARKGYNISLFRHLSELSFSSAITSLTYQYRMNETISWLANKIVYRNVLKCGNSEIAARSLPPSLNGNFDAWNIKYPYKHMSKITEKVLKGKWVYRCLKSSCHLIWLNTDRLGLDLEERRNQVPLNFFEIDIITMVILEH